MYMCVRGIYFPSGSTICLGFYKAVPSVLFLFVFHFIIKEKSVTCGVLAVSPGTPVTNNIDSHDIAEILLTTMA
jgi:hypothetical protein